MLVEQSAQKAFNKYCTPRKKPEVYTIHSSDSESKLGKQKLFHKESDSSESECTMAKPDKPYKYSSPSDSDKDETDNQSCMSNYGAEDRNDKYFTKKGA